MEFNNANNVATQQQDYEIDWNGTITKDNEEFIVLPEGDYEFTVKGFERARFDGSEKMPPCNKAIVKLLFKSPEGRDVTIDHSLLLHSRTEWALSQFFTAIGLKQKDQPLVMNWNLVPGSKGRCQLEVGTSNKGNQYNKVKKFYEPQTTSNYVPGKF